MKKKIRRSIDKSKPLMLYVAEKIYLEISNIKSNDRNITTIEAIERFMGTKIYESISSGEFHNNWFCELEKNNFIDKHTGKKIPIETIKLLNIQKDIVVKKLKIPNSYYTKSFYPLENSQSAFDLLWRLCESYELWCREVGKINSITLKMID